MKKQKTKKHTVENFLQHCAKAKGWDLKRNSRKGEYAVDAILRQPCYYPTLIEYIGEESSKGNLNLEGIQDNISPEAILDLMRIVTMALESETI